MTDFHGRIMNTQGRCASMIVGSVISYSQGYKEARHAAAEIASEADTEIARLRAEIEQMREALTPRGETKAEYIGEFTVPFEDWDCNDRQFTRHIDVPWTTIKEIMAAIRARAALKESDQ